MEFLAIGVPILVNAIVSGVLFVFLWQHLNSRFEDFGELWRAECRRVEEVMDRRLKHLEEKS